MSESRSQCLATAANLGVVGVKWRAAHCSIVYDFTVVIFASFSYLLCIKKPMLESAEVMARLTANHPCLHSNCKSVSLCSWFLVQYLRTYAVIRRNCILDSLSLLTHSWGAYCLLRLLLVLSCTPDLVLSKKV